jgi:hypothetical protein
MFKIIVAALTVVVAAILIMAATRPDTFRVERSIRVSAPPEKIFHYVNDFHQWGVCSTSSSRFPLTTGRRLISGPPVAVPQVTGSMDGPTPHIAKLMGLFFNMDRLIGTDFQTGPADLAAVSET